MGSKKSKKNAAEKKADGSRKSQEAEFKNVFDLALLRAKHIREKYDTSKIEASSSSVIKK